MAVHEFYVYTDDAFVVDDANGTAWLRPDYDPDLHRYFVRVTDDDDFLDGDQGAEEVGDDANQTAEVYSAQGQFLGSGRIYAESFSVYTDAQGASVWADLLEIEGIVVGYSVSENLVPGEVFTLNFTNEIDDSFGDPGVDNRATYSTYVAQSVPCFLSGTMLVTDEGLRPIDWVGVGDRVMTVDHGFQVVRWRGHREFRYAPDMPAPIEIAAGALGPGAPAETIRVSPHHRILMSGPDCALHFGEEEVFVAAKHLLGLPGVTVFVPDLDHAYHHLLFDRHEVLISEGVRLESLFLGDLSISLLPALPHGVVRALRTGHAQTARRSLKAYEAVILAPPARTRREAKLQEPRRSVA